MSLIMFSFSCVTFTMLMVQMHVRLLYAIKRLLTYLLTYLDVKDRNIRFDL